MKNIQPRFIGRTEELSLLKSLTRKNSASLVCLLGRRRIGKSTLIQHFARDKEMKFGKFIEIQGLGPEQKSTLVDQLENFSEKLSDQLNIKKRKFETWGEAFSALAQQTKKGKCLILLDEISWMAKGDPLFSARLKAAWDTEFKHNPQLILVLCGSVSSWIADNLLKHTNFEGRVSLELNLKELTLPEIEKFWKENNFHLSTKEKVLILSITGGVPKYLEELSSQENIEKSLVQSCYRSSGLLFNDFNRIFKDIFGRRTRNLEKIIRACLTLKLSPAELALKLKIPINGNFSDDLEVLELSGFLKRDLYFNPEGKTTRLSHLRVSDNYLRFYLKCIEPYAARINSGGFVISSFKDLKNFDSILGLQFENLILANRTLLYPLIGCTTNQIISAAPYVQKKRANNSGGCQVDLLIHSNLDVFYLCEFKYRKQITSAVIQEVRAKEKILQLPRRSALKPVLVYGGEIANEAEDKIKDYFYRVIHWDELLNLGA